jgi:hypothetical protein
MRPTGSLPVRLQDAVVLTAGAAWQSTQSKGAHMATRSVASDCFSRIRFTAALLLLTPALCLAQTPPDTPATPVPAAIRSAKAVFLANGGADGGLFPEPFSGDPNRGYFSLYSQLKAMGKYDLVADPSQADLVMEIGLVAPTGPHNDAKQLGTADPLPFFRLAIYDAKSHFMLWTITEPIYIAYRQKTHDKNFDDALANVMADLKALGEPGAQNLYPHPPTRLDPWHR